jgi:hypothetical protein
MKNAELVAYYAKESRVGHRAAIIKELQKREDVSPEQIVEIFSSERLGNLRQEIAVIVKRALAGNNFNALKLWKQFQDREVRAILAPYLIRNIASFETDFLASLRKESVETELYHSAGKELVKRFSRMTLEEVIGIYTEEKRWSVRIIIRNELLNRLPSLSVTFLFKLCQEEIFTANKQKIIKELRKRIKGLNYALVSTLYTMNKDIFLKKVLEEEMKNRRENYKKLRFG